MIEVWLMGPTETDMIVNHINHYHINYHHIDHCPIVHHQDILYNILTLVNFSMWKNYDDPAINTMFIKKEGYSIKGEGGSLILTLVREVDF